MTLALPHWTADLKVAVVSDLHVGSPHVGPDRLRRLVAEINDRHPDIVLLLGDFVVADSLSRNAITAARIAVELQQLNPPLGTYAVLGDSDNAYGGKNVYDALTYLGLHALENEAVRVERESGSFWIAGVADSKTSQPDIETTLEPVAGDEPVLLITHNPDLFPDVPESVSLTLAGHTHGGQISLPFLRHPQSGHIVESGRHLFVTTGIGTSGVPARLGVPPEIVILHLTRPR
ncbi:MAG: metallophosphoesterase [Acidobacteriota bacterium]